MEDIAAAKAALRASARRARAALSADERLAAGRRITGRLLRLPELRAARTVATYAAAPGEADPIGLLGPLHARAARTLFPRVSASQLDLVDVRDVLTLTPGYRGIREPRGPGVAFGRVDLILVPGVAFDPGGGRLGQGGGHYDRLLARLPATCVRVGIAFGCQVVPHVPREGHDEVVDVVVTEAAVHRGRPR